MVKRVRLGFFLFLWAGCVCNSGFAQGFSDSMSGTFDVVWEGGTVSQVSSKAMQQSGNPMFKGMGQQLPPKMTGKGYFKGNKIVVVFDDPQIVTKEIYDGKLLIRVGAPFDKMQGKYMQTPGLPTGFQIPGMPGQQPPQIPPSQPKEEPTGWGDTPETKGQTQPEMGMGEMTPKKVTYLHRHFLDFANPDYKTYDARKVKDVTVEGKKCEVYFYEPYYYGNRVVQREDTICDGWLPAKIYLTEYGDFGGIGGEFTYTISNLQTGAPVDDKLFEIPPDYKVMQGNSPDQPMPGLRPFKEVKFPDLPGKFPYCDGAGPGHYIGETVSLPGYGAFTTGIHTFTCNWKPETVVTNFYGDQFIKEKEKESEGVKVSKKVAEKMTVELQKKLQEAVKNVKTEEGKAQMLHWANVLKDPKKAITTAFLLPMDYAGETGKNTVIYVAVLPEYKSEGKDVSFVMIQPVDVFSIAMGQKETKKGLKGMLKLDFKGTADDMAKSMDAKVIHESLEKTFAE